LPAREVTILQHQAVDETESSHENQDSVTVECSNSMLMAVQCFNNCNDVRSTMSWARWIDAWIIINWLAMIDDRIPSKNRVVAALGEQEAGRKQARIRCHYMVLTT
jgi:hypothetical protein